jgi:hypothetical protein
MTRRGVLRVASWIAAYALAGLGLWRVGAIPLGPPGPYEVSDVAFHQTQRGDVVVQGLVTNAGHGSGLPECYIELSAPGVTLFDATFAAISSIAPEQEAPFRVRTPSAIGERRPTQATVTCHQPI